MAPSGVPSTSSGQRDEMGSDQVRKAVFLDRDGVINRLVFNPETSAHESPHSVREFQLLPQALDGLRKLMELGYLLFLVSNQPSYAKGKTSLENLRAIHEKLQRCLTEAGIHFSDYFYCFHHPLGVVPEYACDCDCRKPKPFFVLKAIREYKLNSQDCWFVGDQDTDIYCGQSAGLRTILIMGEHSRDRAGRSRPDFLTINLWEAAAIIYRYGANKEAVEP